MTPQQLLDIPGAGNAKKELIKQGKWDEYAGLPYRDFAVEMKAEITIEDTIIVRARHEDEADDMAAKKFASTHDCDEMDVETIEIRGSKEE